jgi:hypothetical protein
MSARAKSKYGSLRREAQIGSTPDPSEASGPKEIR